MQRYHLSPPHLLWGARCSDSKRVRQPSSSRGPRKARRTSGWAGCGDKVSCSLFVQHWLNSLVVHVPTAQAQTLLEAARQANCTHTLCLSLWYHTIQEGKHHPWETWASVQHPVYSPSRDSNKQNSSSKSRRFCQERHKLPQAKRFQVRPICQGDFGHRSPSLYPEAVPVPYLNPKEFHKRGHNM